MYDILVNGIPMGNANVEKNGLYYTIECNCQFADNKIYRLWVSDDKSKIGLGVCVPEGDRFVLKTKIPAKKLQSNNLVFIAESNQGNEIIIESGKPFSYLDKLDTARLQNINGQLRIVID